MVFLPHFTDKQKPKPGEFHSLVQIKQQTAKLGFKPSRMTAESSSQSRPLEFHKLDELNIFMVTVLGRVTRCWALQ